MVEGFKYFGRNKCICNKERHDLSACSCTTSEALRVGISATVSLDSAASPAPGVPGAVIGAPKGFPSISAVIGAGFPSASVVIGAGLHSKLA